MAGRLKEKDTNTKETEIKGQGSVAAVHHLSRNSYYLLPIACCLLFFSCGTPYGIYHKVEGVQNLASIAKTYDVSIQEIIKVNRLREPVRLKEGDAIFIPGASIEKIVGAHIDDAYTPPKETKSRTSSVPLPKKGSSKADKGRFIWPLEGKLISGFGIRNGEQHKGIDIKAEEGTPVKAADSGKVIYSGNGLSGYGNLIIIKHEGTFFTVYAHNRKNIAAEGDIVEKGDVISEVGDTGRATTPHLHFEVRKSKVTVDPIFYLPEKTRWGINNGQEAKNDK